MKVQVGRKRLGLALGSGGLRGAAHIGVLRSLEKHGLPPDVIGGSSAGAVVAALYACGYSVDEMEQLALRLRPEDVFDLAISWNTTAVIVINSLLSWIHAPESWLLQYPMGLLKGEAWERYLHRVLGDVQMRNLNMPTAILAVDVNSGQSVVFASRQLPPPVVQLPDARLVDAVRSSSAIPGVFAPAVVAGRLLVDGAVKAAVPAGYVRELGADVSLAIDLGYSGLRQDPVDNVLEVVSQSFDILAHELTTLQLLFTADLTVKPGIYDVGLRDFNRIPEMIQRGEEVMDAAIPSLKLLLAQ